MTTDYDAAFSEIRDGLARQRRRRHDLSAAAFEVRVDGTPSGRLDGNITECSFTLRPHDDLIEVFGRDNEGDLLVATHIITRDEDGHFVPDGSNVTLAGHSRFVFSVDPGTARTASCTVRVSSVRGTEVIPATERRPRLFDRRLAVWLPIAAMLVLVVSLPLVLQNRRLRQDNSMLRARVNELQAAAPERLQASRATRAGPENPAFLSIVAITLTPGVDRSLIGADTNTLTLPAGVRSVSVRLPFEGIAKTGDRFVATIEDARGRIIHRTIDLKVTPSEGNKLAAAVFTVPATVLSPGGYLVRLSHDAGAQTNDIQAYRLLISASTSPAELFGGLVVENQTGELLVVTAAGQSTIVPPGASEISLPLGDISVTIHARCGTSDQSVSIRHNERSALVLRCSSG